MAAISSPTHVPERASTPPAPRHGTYYDDWQPYQPRKSARISSQNSEKKTPSPSASYRRKTRDCTSTSPETSPQQKREPKPDAVNRASITSEGAAARAMKSKASQSSVKKNFTTQFAAGLATPKQTPYKAPTESNQDMGSVARNLFGGSATDSSIGTNAKKPKKYSGLTMDSFTAENVDDAFDIFTDSHERIPQRDASAENPFYNEGQARPESGRTRSQKKVMVPGVGHISIEEASRRTDGSVWSFRGKSYFRFENELNGTPVDSEGGRDSLKPRLLFPPTEKVASDDDDEEALTDVEDHIMAESDFMYRTPKKSDAKRAVTPDAPKHALLSPPDTKRTTRSSNKLEETGVRSGQPSLHQFYTHSSTAVSPRRRKRAEEQQKSDVPAKRQRENPSIADLRRTRSTRTV